MMQGFDTRNCRSLFGWYLRQAIFSICFVWSLGLVPIGTVSAQSVQCTIDIPSATEGGDIKVHCPPGTGSGQVEQHFEDVLVPPASGPPLEFEQKRLTLPDNAEELSLKLTSVTIEGSTVYAENELARLYEDRIGQEVAVAEVFRIADEITVKYRNDGYILSRAIVPPQTVEDGMVIIKVVEGFINEIRIEGEFSEEQTLLNAYVDKIISSRPLAIKDLERYLLLIRDLPGIKSEATITASQNIPGASDLVISVQYKKSDSFVRLDNRGSKYNGPVRLWLGGGFNSLTDTHQRATITFTGAGRGLKELTYLDLGYERLIGTEGKKLTFNLTNTKSRPGDFLRILGIDSKTQSVKLGFSNPIIRSRAKNLTLYADFVVRNSETTIANDSEELSNDRVRFISVGAQYDSTDRFGGINQIGLRLDLGMDVLRASQEGTPVLSRQYGQVDFTKLLLDVSRLQRLSENWSYLTSLKTQFTSDKLLASEEFGVGGERCVRAYDPSELTGDRGACLLLEFRYGRTTGAETWTGYQLYGYLDGGTVKRIDPGALGKSASLVSFGLGTRFNYNESLSGSLEAAFPRTKEVDGRPLDVDSVRLFLNLTARF